MLRPVIGAGRRQWTGAATASLMQRNVCSVTIGLWSLQTLGTALSRRSPISHA
jgi:hypothetical protein